jgi:hypothetical protein
MPLATCITPANGDERAQVVPLLDAVHLWTGKRGRPRKRLHVLVKDTGYDAKALRQQLRTRGIRAQIPKRVWKNKPPRGRPIKRDMPRFQAEYTLTLLGKSRRSISSAKGVRLMRGINGAGFFTRHVFAWEGR